MTLSKYVIRTIWSVPFCPCHFFPLPFCPYTILSVPFCPLPFCPRTAYIHAGIYRPIGLYINQNACVCICMLLRLYVYVIHCMVALFFEVPLIRSQANRSLWVWGV